MYGFLLCFASTSVATVMHYVLGMPAPYGIISAPKLLGLSGGLLLVLGCVEMIRLKLVRIFQSGPFGAIRVYKRPRPADAPHPIKDPQDVHDALARRPADAGDEPGESS